MSTLRAYESQTMNPAPAEQATISLSELPIGERAAVAGIKGDLELRQRLLELGLVPGVEVKVSQVAPLGDPLRIELRGAGFSVRRSDAAHVQVQPLAPREPTGTHAAAVVAAQSERVYRVALVGNPNVGKTSLFNALTGHKGRVGNYPGITVDRLVGRLALPSGRTIELVDVPGTYTLNARSRDEQVVLNELMGWTAEEPPDAVVVVLRYATLQRGLYFLMQIQELGQPVIAVVNMIDEARVQGFHVDIQGLAKHFDIPVVGTVAHNGEGLDELQEALDHRFAGNAPPPEHTWHWTPSDHLAEHLDEVGEQVAHALRPGASRLRRRAFALWCLMSLHEDDDFVGIPASVRERTIAARRELEDDGHDLNLEVTQSRYRHIDEDVHRYGWKSARKKHTDTSQLIDRVLTHPFWGLLVFLSTMALLFIALFNWSTPIVDAIDGLFGALAVRAHGLFGGGLVADFVASGLITGVGSVIVFLPQILVLFLFIAILDASGYMARAAFMIDRLMRALGLHGRAFVPMITGFACAVPAIMAARTIERPRDRLLTIMALPLISCSARLPVYTLIIAAMYPATEPLFGPITLGAAMMFGLYVASTVFALLAVGVLGKTVLKGRSTSLILELPPYRRPSVRAIAGVLVRRTKTFLRTAGTVILLASIVLWALLSFPKPSSYRVDYTSQLATAARANDTARTAVLLNARRAEELESSVAGRFGRFIEPVIAPLGFDWRIGVGLLGSFAAREVFVSTMGLIYGVGDGKEAGSTLRDTIRRQRRGDGSLLYTPLTGLSLLVFFMVALQCFSTIAVVRQETGSWKWTLFQLGYLTGLAYLLSFAVYQGGKLLGFS